MQTHKIKVINHNSFVITDMYDGIAWHFKPGAGVNLELDVARHIFGVDFPADAAACAGQDLRAQVWEYVLRRWGWNSPDDKRPDKMSEAMAIFKKIEFKPVVFTITEVISGGDSEEPPPPRASKQDKAVGHYKPRGDKPPAEEQEEVA